MTVCGDNDWYWDLREATVICKMLGFDGALDAPGSATFGRGSGDILYVDCWGTEDSLADCPYIRVTSSCTHDEDVGAICYSGGINSFYVETINGNCKLHSQYSHFLSFYF